MKIHKYTNRKYFEFNVTYLRVRKFTVNISLEGKSGCIENGNQKEPVNRNRDRNLYFQKNFKTVTTILKGLFILLVKLVMIRARILVT